MSANITRKLFTFDDCLRMSETGILSPTERVELIGGEILLMSPIGPRHAAAVDATTERMIELAARRAIVRGQTTVVLDRFAAPQPDIAVLRRRDDFYASKHPGAADILLIVEIADSSLEYDTSVKLGLYAILGIPEYWVADLQKNRLLVYSHPKGDSYQEMRELRRGEVVTALLLPECCIPVDLLLP
jgi:Uma2 family endonuclease